MKSIKEKSIEIYPALEGDLSSTSENLVKRKGFQTGANYVLDIIEQYCKEHIVCSSNIKHVIEQLKK